MRQHIPAVGTGNGEAPSLCLNFSLVNCTNAGDTVRRLRCRRDSRPGGPGTASHCQQLLETQVEETKLQAPGQRGPVTNLVSPHLPQSCTQNGSQGAEAGYGNYDVPLKRYDQTFARGWAINILSGPAAPTCSLYREHWRVPFNRPHVLTRTGLDTGLLPGFLVHRPSPSHLRRTVSKSPRIH